MKHFRVVHRLSRRIRVIAPPLIKEAERCYILEILLRKASGGEGRGRPCRHRLTDRSLRPARPPEERLLATLDAVLGNLLAAPKALPVAAVPVDGPVSECSLAVEGMTCASCPYIVKNSMASVPGVTKVAVSFETKTATVTFDDAKTNTNAIAAAPLAVRLVSTFRSSAREIAARRGVRIAKWLGDGVMFVSVEAGPLLATTVELTSRMKTTGMDLRSGVATGSCLLFEADDYIGHSVNLASRLCDLAGPGEVLADENTATLAPDWVRVGPPRRKRLPGVGKVEGICTLRFDSDIALSA